MKKIQDLGYTKKKHIIDGVSLVIVGVLLIIFQSQFPKQILSWLTVILFLLAIWNVVSCFWKKDGDTLLTAIIKVIIFGIIAYGTWLENLIIGLAVFIIGLYQLLLAVINGITYWIYKKDNIPHRVHYLRDSLLFTFVGISSLVGSITRDGNGQMFILGIYFVTLGWTNIRDGLIFDSAKGRQDLKRRVRVSLPIVIVALVPITVLRKINTYLAENDGSSAIDGYNQVKSNVSNDDLQVFVHVSNDNVFGAMGHVDLCYKGQVYAYGNYDVKSERLFGSIGDGILFNATKDDYIAFCQKEDKKTIFEYGIALDDTQRQGVEEQLALLQSWTIPFQPSSELISEKNGVKIPMYSYRLQQDINGKIFKFTQSKFKTYFVLSTNCVLLADTVIGKTGTDRKSVV